MANTGVLPFVRGINFAKNDFKVSSSDFCIFIFCDKKFIIYLVFL